LKPNGWRGQTCLPADGEQKGAGQYNDLGEGSNEKAKVIGEGAAFLAGQGKSSCMRKKSGVEYLNWRARPTG